MPATGPTYATFGRTVERQASQMMIVKSHALSVTQQSPIILPNRPELWSLQDDISASLKRSRQLAGTMLSSYVPAIDGVLAGVDGFLRMKQRFAQMLGPAPLSAQALGELRNILSAVGAFRSAATTLAYGMGTLRQKLFDEAGTFKQLAGRLNGVVNGDQGVLRAIEDAIARIDREIAAADGKSTASGFAALGGAFLFLVGAVASIFTGGAAAPVAVLGGTLLFAGAVGTVTASNAVAGLLDEKSRLLQDQARLKAEVAVMAGASGTLGSLSDSAAGAAAAVQDMINAWTLLEGGLRSLIANVEQGANDNGALTGLFGSLAQSDIQSIIDTVAIIRRQLSGSRDVVDPARPLARLVQQEARRLAA